jgi:all-trans-retinol 13,14-reductase
VSTPLSVESFTSHPNGMIYGQACKPDRLFENAWKVKTSLRNLYLTGSDVGVPGVNGALLAGVMTSAKVLGMMGFPRIFSAVDQAAAAQLKMKSG